MFTIQQIKAVNDFVKSGISKDDICELYDTLKADIESRLNPSPPNSQPSPDCVNHGLNSPTSSQLYSMPLGIQSPPYTDDEPWSQNTTISVEKKRDRFVFKPIHYDILNDAFKRNQYPENEDKEILADECNRALMELKNRSLKETEKVTVFNVTNWFNNRRKEKKKKGGSETNSNALDEPMEDRIKEEIISAD